MKSPERKEHFQKNNIILHQELFENIAKLLGVLSSSSSSSSSSLNLRAPMI